MIFTIFSVFNILIGAAMIILILIQRGAGSDAGAGFGGGASGTVFGARGSASFLTRTTGVLAGLFFLLSLGMGMYVVHEEQQRAPGQDLGVMASLATPATSSSTAAPEQLPVTAPQPENAAVPAPQPLAPESAPVADSVVPEPQAVEPAASSSAPTQK